MENKVWFESKLNCLFILVVGKSNSVLGPYLNKEKKILIEQINVLNFL